MSDVLIGVGMPALLYLHEFGSQVWHAFGNPPFLVGSSLRGKQWRDVDVRLILPDGEGEAYWDIVGLGETDPHQSGKWVALCMAFSALGTKMTGLPIDFQIQGRTHANGLYGKQEHPRHLLGMLDLRMKRNV